jgi:lysophospholipase
MQIAPFFDDIAHGPKGGAAHWVITSDQTQIRVAHWPLKAAKGTVLIFPGRTEYIEKYGLAAQQFQDAGYASVAIDWRGQGLADRLIDNPALGHVGAFADYQRDVNAALSHIKELGLPEPYYLMAHSMGGCIGLEALMQDLPVKAASFSAPMWGISFSPEILRPVSWVMTAVAGATGQAHRLPPTQVAENYIVKEPFAGNTLTHDPAMWDHLKQQMTAQPELALGGPTLHWLGSALREMRRHSGLPSPDVPTVAFCGDQEVVVDPRAIKDRMTRWANGTLHHIENAAHELTLESPPIRAFVFQTMIAHFNAYP